MSASNTHLGRRSFLQAAAASPLVYSLLGGTLPAAEEQSTASGLIVREKLPENLETPLSGFEQYITPNDLFYVRDHFARPEIDLKNWKLSIEGAVENPFTLDYEELKRQPSRSQAMLLECAGNGRSYLSPKQGGVQWTVGAVSNAEWKGVPLALLLEKARPRAGAVEVILEGADSGEVKDPPRPEQPVHFARSLPLAKARSEEVILAHEMNGKPLPKAHGFPVRAVVGGWYGMASVKWLTRIIVTTQPFGGYFQTTTYTTWEKDDGVATMRPIRQILPKSIIVAPAPGTKVTAGKPYRVRGLAWAGEASVRQVQVSTDAGKKWSAAKLLDSERPFSWRFWEYEWHVPQAPGMVNLLARAHDDHDRNQPLERVPDRRNYLINNVVPVAVEVV
ncbi:MAG TPA: sulfite oxidase [Planctomycetaceae bacterium]|nr:sulfite oxidase [Planctomycetaceae bacterium]